MSKRKTAARWMSLRCDASMQSPSSYGRNGYGIEPPPAPEGKVCCPVCWKPVKLMQRVGFGGRRIPAHNVDHDLVQQKEEAMQAAAISGQKPAEGEKA
ncbi:hypothetical protein D3C86_1321420 [compost metagenome]